eukprot:m.27145 g.27145  ORF g.27145 m.27145 type:complete len:56 (+) comp8899_c0_seq1:1687-1854(+)
MAGKLDDELSFVCAGEDFLDRFDAWIDDSNAPNCLIVCDCRFMSHVHVAFGHHNI